MNITREQTGKQTSTVRIEIQPDDYRENVNKVLKDLQRKANIPGFRPGHVPFGLISKMYGKAVLADEINKMISDSLTSYIREEKIELLGNPLPNAEKTPPVNFDKQEPYEFYFDLGEAPSFDLNLSSIPPVDRYLIQVDDEMVDRYVDDTRRRYGVSTHPEESAEGDLVSGEITELDPQGVPIENGIRKNVLLDPDRIRTGKCREKLVGLKKESRLSFTPGELFDSTEDAAQFLGIPHEKAGEEGIRFEMEVKDIHHVEPAAVDSEFFEKVYPGKNIESEEDFREQVRNDAAGSFAGETERFFYHLVSDTLVKETPIPLPDDFLKRWLKEQKKNKMSAGEIERQYGLFADSMRWQLIENRLIRDHGISVTDDDIRQYIRNYFLRQIPLSQDDPEVSKRYDALVDTVMQNEEQVRKINDELYTARLMELFKTQIPVEEKSVTYEEFIKLASVNHIHDHDHASDHDPDHEDDEHHEHEH